MRSIKAGKIRSFRKQERGLTDTGIETLELLLGTHFPGSKTLDLNSVTNDLTKHIIRAGS